MQCPDSTAGIAQRCHVVPWKMEIWLRFLSFFCFYAAALSFSTRVAYNRSIGLRKLNISCSHALRTHTFIAADDVLYAIWAHTSFVVGHIQYSLLNGSSLGGANHRGAVNGISAQDRRKIT